MRKVLSGRRSGDDRSVRRPAAAGRFYSGDPGELLGMVRGLLEAARPRESIAEVAAPKALLVPHAGFVYSGSTAARGFARLAPVADSVARVVLLGPTHYVGVEGLALPAADAFATPLGVVPVEPPSASGVAELPQVVVSAAAHEPEHSLEVQLPFLQVVLGEFVLVPFAVGWATPQGVAQVLARVWGGPETVVVVSSDLSHYLSYDQARAQDRATVEQILALQGPLSHDQACGATPLNGLLVHAARTGLRPELLGLCNSGDTAGDKRRVVGYAAVAFAA